jgi:hypothetical protein
VANATLPHDNARGTCDSPNAPHRRIHHASAYTAHLALTPAPVTAPVLKVKTRIRAGGLSQNHNETLVKTSPPMKDLHVKTRIKAGSIIVRD